MVVLSNNQRLLTCCKGRLLFKELREVEYRICLSVLMVHPQNVQLHNVQLQNVQLPNVQLQNVQDTKRPGYKTSSYQTSSYRTSRTQNVQFFVNFETCFKKPEAEGRAYLMRSMRKDPRGSMLRLTQLRGRDTHALCSTCVMRSMGVCRLYVGIG